MSRITDEEWESLLLRGNCIEHKNQQRKRDIVVNMLRLLIPTLVRQIAVEYGLKQDDFQCQILPFGSYGLGANLIDSDIDVVFLAPSEVRRSDFFRIFPSILKEQATVQDVETVENTTVPIIKCTIDRIPVDISFVRLKIASVPENINILDNKHLSELDDSCIVSIDGVRVTQFILEQIRNEDLPTFRLCLQAIRWWAKQRHIYNKPIGYLNGGCWALLLLKTYQMYKNEISVQGLLTYFFELWTNWPWPSPVILTDGIPDFDGRTIDYKSLVEFEDALMAIVTPCYRVSNASPNVSVYTLNVVKKELARARAILHSHFDSPRDMTSKLFKKYNIIKDHSNFLVIVVSCDTYTTYETWLGKMHNAIPRLLELMEQVPEIKDIRPYTEPITQTINFNTRAEKICLQTLQPVVRPEIDHRRSMLEPGMLYRTCHILGIDVKLDKDGEQTVVDVSKQVSMFKRIVDSRRNRKENDMVVNVVSKKRKDLVTLLNL